MCEAANMRVYTVNCDQNLSVVEILGVILLDLLKFHYCNSVHVLGKTASLVLCCRLA